ncbi:MULTISPECIES: hypothetical protein [Kordiimonas]|uniref:hypothetical protein n=1 Tax=Kordiimonas TaxID=288021 RepID=UPI00257C507A|nr:hypothetical protein [Kordiimonas sp. UBA4487]
MGKFPTFGLKSVLLAGVVALSSTSAQACIKTAELKADQMRFLELQLKVAALRCRFENPQFASLYNRFVVAHKGAIKASRWPVEAYLARQTRMDMDTYVTKTANRISFESMDAGYFCENAAAVADMAASYADPLMVIDLLPVRYQTPRPVCADRTAPTTATVATPDRTGAIDR